MIEWRFFDVNDVDWIIDSSKVMFAESEWKEGEYDEEKIRNYLLYIIENPLTYCGLIGLKDDQRAGFFIGRFDAMAKRLGMTITSKTYRKTL